MKYMIMDIDKRWSSSTRTIRKTSYKKGKKALGEKKDKTKLNALISDHFL